MTGADRSIAPTVEPDGGVEPPEGVWRESTTMVLYVTVVLFATLAALPSGHRDGGPVRGPVGRELIAIIWGTTIGLALVHWFAFQVATQGLSRGLLRGRAAREVTAQLAGATFVAVVASIPVLMLPEETEQGAVLVVLAFVVGGVGYLVERASGRTRAASVAFGGVTMLVAFAVAAVKIALSSH